MRSGPRNAITDIAGLFAGNASDDRIRTGVTVLTADAPFAAAVHVMGGAPGARETDLLAPDKLVDRVDAIVLSGGSALGLDAASGVADELRAAGKGFDADGQIVPIVPAAIIFDLGNGGEKNWTVNPYRALGAAALAAAARDFAIGSEGAGAGALVAGLKGGLGTASAMPRKGGPAVGALVAVNASGQVTMGDSPHFWAAPWEVGEEFGGLGPGSPPDPSDWRARAVKRGGATTIAIVATDAALDKAGLQRMATAAHDGIARAIVPSHTPVDGDLVFAVSTRAGPAPGSPEETTALGHAAATCLARAVARGVYSATASEDDALPAWSARFGQGPPSRPPRR